MLNARELVGTADILFITIDTLRFDVARDTLAAGRTPNLAQVLPSGGWEKRHSPASFTYAAHQSFFAGFLPTPCEPGLHPRLFAARFEGSTTVTDETCVFDETDIVRGLSERGYRTLCIGGVGFFNKQTSLGMVLPAFFDESYWDESLSVIDPRSTENQVGGTPTFFNAAALNSLFDVAEEIFGCDVTAIPASCETSPLTAEKAKLQLLRERGIDRISIGVQGFVEAEVGAVGRSQKTKNVEQALENIREVGFPVLTIDLMYGLPEQTVESWLASLNSALRFAPEELYLYPLYVRPLTGIGRRSMESDDIRLALYREARSLLKDAGYEQVSMRMFRLTAAAAKDNAPVYCCQDDGMVGLGCGARSYTQTLHYSSEYSVEAGGIREIIDRFIATPSTGFSFANHGFRLSDDEQRRRFVIKSVLQTKGLDLEAYRERFGNDPQQDLPQLSELLSAGLAVKEGQRFSLSEEGLAMSDAIAPWLYSTNVHDLMNSYQLR